MSARKEEQLAQFFQQTKQAILKYTPSNIQICLPLYYFEQKFDNQKQIYICLPKKQLTLSSSSIQLVLRILEIAKISLSNLQNNVTITKRNLYYQLKKYYSDYAVIDNDIKLLCQSLNLKRKDLGIVASSRCLLYGKFTVMVDGVQKYYISKSPQIITVPTCTQVRIIGNFSRKILLIEKESIFYVLCQNFSELSICQFMLMTAKGYPDQVTRELLYSMKDEIDVVYYLGDWDVYGFDIFFFYAFGDWACPGLLEKIELLQLYKFKDQIFMQELLEQEYCKFNIGDLKKVESIKNRHYFTPQLNKTKLGEKIRHWSQYFDQFVKLNQKAEVQSFVKCAKNKNWIIQLISRQNAYQQYSNFDYGEIYGDI